MFHATILPESMRANGIASLRQPYHLHGFSVYNNKKLTFSIVYCCGRVMHIPFPHDLAGGKRPTATTGMQ
jgi:hypothetical protein